MIKKILVLRFSGLGDVVMTLPVVERLREDCPSCHIAYLTDARWRGLLENCGLVDEALYFDRMGFKKGTPGRRLALGAGLLNTLLRARVDCALEMQAFGETGIMARLSGARMRVGWIKRPSQKWWINRPVPGMTGRHRVQYFNGFRLCRSPEALRLRRPPLLKRTSAQEEDRVVLFVGASQPFRQWPLEHFLDLAGLVSGLGLRPLLLGGPTEGPLIEAVRSKRPELEASLCESVPELIDCLSRAAILVCGDTGPIHVGGALGVPHIIGLYAPHNLEHSTPIHSDRLDVLAKKDLADISPRSVLERLV